ncbi:MAG: ATP-binding cassette domain-containing protein, partial [Oscillospiraceae bacterium]
MGENILSLMDITMQFGGVVAVDNLSLDVNENEIVALIGPNGAGKTTAFNCITGVYEPTNGAVAFMGEKIIENYPKGKLKKEYLGSENGKYLGTLSKSPDKITKLGIARTFQNIRLFKELSVLENVMIACHMH